MDEYKLKMFILPGEEVEIEITEEDDSDEEATD
jgi:hypothetical protein